MDKSSQQNSTDARRKTLQKELRRVETSIYELEFGYLQECVGGSAMHGWESDITSLSDSNSTKSEVRIEDMMFSKSSMSSPLYAKHTNRVASASKKS